MKNFLKSVGCFLGLSGIVFGSGFLRKGASGSGKLKPFCEWFLEQHPIAEWKAEVTEKKCQALDKLNRLECLLLLAYFIKGKQPPLVWLLNEVEGCTARRPCFNFIMDVCCNPCRKRESEIKPSDESKSKVEDVLEDWFYVDEEVFCQKLNALLKALGWVDDGGKLGEVIVEIIKKEVALDCFSCLNPTDFNQVYTSLLRKEILLRGKKCELLEEAINLRTLIAAWSSSSGE